ncbi:MAG: hypothetical protein LQ342_008510 [Letrouitia transgressa]|nr:MAG: hypothetical protein LQ342_008510 [Letrouitia transgressa]
MASEILLGVPPQTQMMPPSKCSIGHLGFGSWSMGSSVICEKEDECTDADTLTTWNDKDETWRLRRRDPPLTATITPPGDSDFQREYVCGNVTAIWRISPNVLCKVKSWMPGVTPEADTIMWVAKNCPTIPVPKVIHSWIDQDWQRSFCLMEAVPGVTLDQAWNGLSMEERTAIANEVVTYIVDAAQHTSPRISSANGTGITYHGWILGTSRPEIKGADDWQPDLHPPMTPEELDERLVLIGGQKSPEKVDHFIFFHGDLAPVNIFLDKNEKDEWHVSSIIDWEVAGFLPKWYIRTIVGVSTAHLLNQAPGEEEMWSVELSRALEKRGFQEYCKWLNERLSEWVKHPIYLPRASG